MCSGTECETHVKSENKEEQLSTEKEDKAKVTAVRSLYYHSHTHAPARILGIGTLLF